MDDKFQQAYKNSKFQGQIEVEFGFDRWTDNYVASVDTLNPGYLTMSYEKTPVFHLQRGSEELPWDAVWNRGLHGWLWKDCWSFMDLANDQGLPEQGELLLHILIEEHHYRIPK